MRTCTLGNIFPEICLAQHRGCMVLSPRRGHNIGSFGIVNGSIVAPVILSYLPVTEKRSNIISPSLWSFQAFFKISLPFFEEHQMPFFIEARTSSSWLGFMTKTLDWTKHKISQQASMLARLERTPKGRVKLSGSKREPGSPSFRFSTF